MIEEWLKSKGVTLWADWDISADDQRAKAAEWFSKQLSDYFGFAMSYHDKRIAESQKYGQEYPTNDERFDVV